MKQILMPYWIFLLFGVLLFTYIGCTPKRFKAAEASYIQDCRGVCLSARTDKGVNTPVYKKGEDLILHVKTKQSAYISVLYKDVEGVWYALGQNYPNTNPDLVDKWLQLPSKFTFMYEPYGREEIRVIATSERMMECAAESIGGTQVVRDPDTCMMGLRHANGYSEVSIPIKTAP